MKLFKPQLQLAKESEMQDDGSFRDHYYLHVVTFTDKTNYRAEDYQIDDHNLASKGVINVRLYINADMEIADLNYLTPVVHTLDLGTPIEKGAEFIIQVDVFKGLPTRDGSGGGSSSGSSQTSSGGADDTDRPIENE